MTLTHPTSTCMHASYVQLLCVIVIMSYFKQLGCYTALYYTHAIYSSLLRTRIHGKLTMLAIYVSKTHDSELQAAIICETKNM